MEFMKYLSRKKIVVLVAFPAVFALFFLFYPDVDEVLGRSCNKLEGIAGSRSDLSFLREWAVQRNGDAEFLEIFEQTDDVYAYDNPRLFSLIDLEWGDFGINEGVASVKIWRNENDDQKLDAISFGEGRNSLLIKLERDFLPDEISSDSMKWSKITDDSFVYCDKRTSKN